MTEDRTNRNKPTASNLFFNALLNNAESHSQAANEARKRGSTEVEETHIKKMLDDLEKLSNLIEDPDFKYPRLTPEENDMLRILESEEFIEQTAEEKKELKRLRNKAWGVE